MDSKLYFEDLAIGMVIEGDEVVVDRTEMLDFARRVDPQPFHLDKAAAERLSFRDVIASGAYTFALGTRAMQPIVRRLAFLPRGVGFELSFKEPVYADDRLKFRSDVAERRASRKPQRGVARMKHECLNQHGGSVMAISVVWRVATRAV